MRLIIILILLFTLGCQQDIQKETEQKMLQAQENVSEIIIIELHDNVSNNLSHTIKDKDSLELFINAFNNSEEIKGSLDMPDPNYKITILLNNDDEKNFYLWLNEYVEEGTISTEEDTETGYTIPANNTKSLFNYFKKNNIVSLKLL